MRGWRACGALLVPACMAAALLAMPLSDASAQAAKPIGTPLHAACAGGGAV